VAILSVAIATVVFIGGSSAARAPERLVTYPAPVGQALSPDYSVKVRTLGGPWRGLDAYWVLVDLKTHSSSAMVEFDAGGPVQVSITKLHGTMSMALVRPLSYGVRASVGPSGKTATFVLSRPMNVSFEPDGDRLHNVQVFVNPIETDRPRAGRNVIVFGPGRHTIGGDHTLRVRSNTTVYIAGGAVVQGTLAITNARNVVVGGHGILDPLLRFKPTILVEHSAHVGIQDVTLRRAQNGGVNVTDSNDVVVAGVREINVDRFSDGLDIVSSSNVLADGLFLRTSDDSVAVYASTPWGGHGSTRDIAVRNSTLWADAAHPIIVGAIGDPSGHETVQHADFQNLDILEDKESDPLYQGALAVDAGNNVTARAIRFEKVRIDHITRGQIVNVRVFKNPYYNTQPGAGVAGVLFRNVSVRGQRQGQSVISGYDATRQVANVTLENLTYDGTTALDPAAADIAVGPYTDDVVFRARPRTVTYDDSASALHYVGRWKVAAAAGAHRGSVRLASGDDDRMDFVFTGSEARVYGTTAPDRGQVDVYVDGSRSATVDTYSTVRRMQQIWFDTGVLPVGRHTLELRCRGTHNILAGGAAIALDKLVVVG